MWGSFQAVTYNQPETFPVHFYNLDLFWLVCYHQNFKEILPVKSITGDETQYKKNPLFFSKVRLGMGNSHMSKPLPKQCTVMPKFGNNLQVRRFLFKRIKESILIWSITNNFQILEILTIFFYPQLHYSVYSASLPKLHQTKGKKKPTGPEHLHEGEKVFKKVAIKEWRVILCSVYV